MERKRNSLTFTKKVFYYKMKIVSLRDNINDFFLDEISTEYKDPVPYDIFIFCKDVFITSTLRPFIKMAIQLGHIYCKGLHIIYNKSKPVFVNMPVLFISELKEKELHRYTCLKKLEDIRKIPLSIKNYSIYQTVLIEFRPLPHLEYLIRNTIHHLPSWSHTVVCGLQNYEMIRNWFPMLSIITLPIQNIVASEYSQLLLKEDFWKQFHGNKLLIYQEDSMLFHGKIEPFLIYDYVGAPWPEKQNDNPIGVGNGGFSLRSKKCMIECLQTVPYETVIPSSSTLEYMKNTNSTCIPEDVYFTKTMIEHKIGVVAPREVARSFSQESLKSQNPLGGHQFWLADMNYGIVLGTDYYSTVTHRAGWNSIISYFNENHTFKPDGVLLIDCMEKYFMWEKRLCEKPWVGIAHYSIIPKYYSLNTLVKLKNLTESLPYCKGIIVLSSHNLSILPNVRTIALKHPIMNISKCFSVEHFKKCNPSVIQLGAQDRIEDFVYNLKTTYPKVWMPGKEVKSKIPVLYTKNNDEYDTILLSNIIVIPLLASSANNSILEIIAMNIPTFVSRLPSTEEYLGKDYPMFFNTKEDVEKVINNKDKMFTLYETTYQYLKKMDKSDLSIETFRKNVVDFCLS
jgi:hypothetical protein